MSTRPSFLAQQKEQTFAIRVDRDVPSCIVSDQQRLSQIISNLISNAIKFTPPHGSISLHVQLLAKEEDTCTLVFNVIDTGIGVSAEQQARLWKSFEQADSSISRRFGGTGLGLAITKGIISQMGGTVGVESQLGHGARFFFTLPVRYTRAYTLPPLDESITPQLLRVLVIDPSEMVRAFAKDIAETAGIAIETAPDYDAALALLGTGAPVDIVFVDCAREPQAGLRLAQTLRDKHHIFSIVLMVTEMSRAALDMEGSASGQWTYMMKPLLPTAMIGSINACLSQQSCPLDAPDLDDCTGIFGGKHILLAEDVDINQEILSTILEETDVDIDIADNGRKALHSFEQSPDKYDLILMDIHMPEMDGYQATRGIRALRTPHAKEVPIVALTANVFKEDVERCLASGMDDHIGKPIDVQEVMRKLHKYLLTGYRHA